MSVLADVQHATGVARIAELDGEAQLRRGVVGAGESAAGRVRRGCRSGPGCGRRSWTVKFGELGALGRSEQLAGGHGGLAYAAAGCRRKLPICCGNAIL